ncbi:hypothetical protein OUZ56_021754 [Daphnia magna]|uniref:Uncharacterized protein n=1 Tax=Daphnia magna TaxID=35525 RepID=A0ABR0AUE4_9CRUS|nr:hypothetical protein OUZ56_021754 [Daphnia magna]
MATVRKFISLHIVRGSPTEDARQWLERNETISIHNDWGDADKTNYFRNIARNYFKNPESKHYKGPPKDAAEGATSEGNLPINLAVSDTSRKKSDCQETYELELNPARLIRKAAKCNCISADRYSSCSHKTSKWTEDSSRKRPYPVTAEYRRVVICDKEIAALLHAEKCEEHLLVSKDRQEILAYTVKQIPSTISNKMEGLCIVTPSGTTSPSTGQELVKTDLENIPVA